MEAITRPAKTSLNGAPPQRDSSSPRVSVVIPTHNRGNIVGRAVRSALEQTLSDIEVIVVDDGSTDDTADVLSELDEPRLRTVHLPLKGGVAHARNVGIAQARAEWVALLDDDDEWLPRKLESQIERADATNDARVGAVYCSLKFITPEGEESPFAEARLSEGQILRELLWPGQLVTPSTFLLKRRALFEVGGFDESFEAAEDRDCWLRLASAGYHFRAVPQDLTVVHRAHGPSMMTDAVGLARGLARYHRRWDPIAKRELPDDVYEFTRTSRRLMLERLHRKCLKRFLRRGSRRRAGRYVRAMLQVVPAYPWLWPFVWRAFLVTVLGLAANRLVAVPPRSDLRLPKPPILHAGAGNL
jgi:glycosyltransferase involved in cell wall biosynthesis